MKKLTAILLFAALMIPAFRDSATGENIDLVTLPSRDGVQLTIYNSEDITLVKETRSISFKKGMNKLQFSWANTLIDPTSVEFRPIEHKDQIQLVDTVFPGEKPQHLFWNIDSQYEGQAKVEVSYFTSGLTWRMDYVLVSDPDETKLKFDGYVTVFNRSGEEYDYAEIRLIVGNINLVEKISQLARQRGMQPPAPATPEEQDMRNEVLENSFGRAADGMRKLKSGAPGADREKGIVKEGLSEYFMFSIEGQETVPNGWSKRMRAIKAEDVPFDILYRMRSYQYGPRPVRFFIWKNDKEHKLGESPLPDGVVRLFRENGRDGLSFLGQQKVDYVPIKADVEINLGPDDLVVYDSHHMGSERLNFHFRISNAREYVDGWDEKQMWRDRVRNYRAKPIKFELRRIFDGDVEYASDIKGSLFDYRTVETVFTVDPRSRKTLSSVVHYKHGDNAKQKRILMK
ncbi:MAG: hypothetical protein Kow00107_04610 [Planctomycetota bacterium]